MLKQVLAVVILLSLVPCALAQTTRPGEASTRPTNATGDELDKLRKQIIQLQEENLRLKAEVDGLCKLAGRVLPPSSTTQPLPSPSCAARAREALAKEKPVYSGNKREREAQAERAKKSASDNINSAIKTDQKIAKYFAENSNLSPKLAEAICAGRPAIDMTMEQLLLFSILTTISEGKSTTVIHMTPQRFTTTRDTYAHEVGARLTLVDGKVAVITPDTPTDIIAPR